MTTHRARLYFALALLGLLPLVGATTALGWAYGLPVGTRATLFQLALFLFGTSFLLTRLRIYIGGRSPRSLLLTTHILASIPTAILLITVSFFYDAPWIASLLLLCFVCVLVSGLPVWQRSVVRAYTLLRD